MTRSTKSENVNAEAVNPVVVSTNGRTIYDMLSGKGNVILALILIAMALLFAHFMNIDLTEPIRENIPYLVPVIGGLYFGKWLYYNHIRRIVILRRDDVQHNVYYEFAVSTELFKSMKKDEFAIPSVTNSGVMLFHCDLIDFDNNQIVYAGMHNRMSSVVVISRDSLFKKMCKHGSEITKENVELDNALYIRGRQYSRRIVKDTLDSVFDSERYEKALDDKDSDVSEDVKDTEGPQEAVSDDT